jgi:hypothetical protein
LTRRLGSKEWIENLFLHLWWDAATVVADPDFDPITKVSRRGRKDWLIAVKFRFRLAPRRRIETVRNQVDKDACNLLREQIDLADGGISRLILKS